MWLWRISSCWRPALTELDCAAERNVIKHLTSYCWKVMHLNAGTDVCNLSVFPHYDIPFQNPLNFHKHKQGTFQGILLYINIFKIFDIFSFEFSKVESCKVSEVISSVKAALCHMDLINLGTTSSLMYVDCKSVILS